MTREGFAKLMTYLATAWPMARIEEWNVEQLGTWMEELAPYTDDEVRKALRRWTKVEPRAFPPALNELVHAADGASDARRWRERAAREAEARASAAEEAERRLDEWLAAQRRVDDLSQPS